MPEYYILLSQDEMRAMVEAVTSLTKIISEVNVRLLTTPVPVIPPCELDGCEYPGTVNIPGIGNFCQDDANHYSEMEREREEEKPDNQPMFLDEALLTKGTPCAVTGCKMKPRHLLDGMWFCGPDLQTYRETRTTEDVYDKPEEDDEMDDPEFEIPEHKIGDYLKAEGAEDALKVCPDCKTPNGHDAVICDTCHHVFDTSELQKLLLKSLSRNLQLHPYVVICDRNVVGEAWADTMQRYESDTDTFSSFQTAFDDAVGRDNYTFIKLDEYLHDVGSDADDHTYGYQNPSIAWVFVAYDEGGEIEGL